MSDFFTDLQLSDDLKRQATYLANRIAGDSTQHILIEGLTAAITERDQNKVGLFLNQGLNEYGPIYPIAALNRTWETITSVFETLQLSEETRLNTLSDIRLWIDHHRTTNNGESGLSRVFWINRLITARIIQFGRLQFEKRSFPYHVTLYQKDDHSYGALLNEGVGIDRAGYITNDEAATTRTSGEGEIIDLETGAVLTHTKEKATIHPLYKEGDPVIFIHIPALGPLEPALVEQSLEMAVKFFGEEKLYICTSWLLDPALKTVVEETSNIWQFNQRFKKLPVCFDYPQIFERVFDTNNEKDVLAAEATSSLQRNVQEALKAGVTFRTMGGYFFR